jgi:hypothetical protein
MMATELPNFIHTLTPSALHVIFLVATSKWNRGVVGLTRWPVKPEIAGSSPVGSAKYFPVCADVAQLVEHQLPKLRAAGSNPVIRSIFSAGVAQLAERFTRNEQVTGSIPVASSKPFF